MSTALTLRASRFRANAPVTAPVTAPVAHTFGEEVPMSTTQEQAARFDRIPGSCVAVQHSVPHEVISQVIRPDVAALMAYGRVVIRTHRDELCCVDSVKFIGKGAPFGAADVEYLQQFPHLVRLNFGGRATTASLAVVTKGLPQLQHLDLSSCDGVNAAGLAEVGKLSQLERLDLRWCDGVDAAGLAEVGKLTRLQHLDLKCCDGVDSAGLAHVAKLPQLEHLNLSLCDAVDAQGLSVVNSLPQLQSLGLSFCDGVDAAALAEVEKLPRLREIQLDHCPGVKATDLAALKSKCLIVRH